MKYPPQKYIYDVTSFGSINKGKKLTGYWSTTKSLGAGIYVEYFGKLEPFIKIYSNSPLTNEQIKKVTNFFRKKYFNIVFTQGFFQKWKFIYIEKREFQKKLLLFGNYHLLFLFTLKTINV